MTKLEVKEHSRNSFSTLEEASRKFLEQMENKPKITSCDHVCYVIKSKERFEEIERELLKRGELIHELEGGQFKGARFSIFKINVAEVFNDQKFDIIELKLSNSPKLVEGFQHVEYIIDGKLQELVNSNPKVEFETHRIDNPDNKEIGAHLKSENVIGIKFREKPLISQF